MMKLPFLRTYPLTALEVPVIWVLCLMPVPETPLQDVPFVDKWTHVVMYAGLCGTFWTEHLLRGSALLSGRILLLAMLLPAGMSGALELLQAYATTCRSGEWLDFLANTAGVLLGTAYGWIVIRFSRKGKGK